MVAASAMMITAPLLAKQTIALGAILRVRFKIFLPQEGRRTRRATSSKAWHARAQAVFAERNQCGTLCGTFVRFDAVNWGFVRLRFYEFPVCRQNQNVRNALIYWAFRIALSGDPSRIRTCNPRSRNPLLYPVELWDRWRLHSIANMKNPLRRQVRSEPFSAIRRPSGAVGRCVRSTRIAMYCRGRQVAGDTGPSPLCRMRLFRYPVPPP